MDAAAFLGTVLPSALILAWCGALGAVWLLCAFERRARLLVRDGAVRGIATERRELPLLPALALGPVAVACGFRVLGIDVLFPIMMSSDTSTLVVAAIVPAVVLAAASGLLGQLARSVDAEILRWQDSAFMRGVRARGSSPRRALRRLVLVQAATQATSAALPWLFGELIVIEAVFNAPGLGQAAWHAARMRDFAAMAPPVIALVVLYALCAGVSAGAHAWIGRRLASYA